MRFLSRFALIIVLVASFPGISPAAANRAYFLIKSEKDKTILFEVTDAVIAKIGTIHYKAILPGMDGGQHDVRGPLVRDLLKAAGVHGVTAYAYALDLYNVDIPLADFQTYDVIAAIEVDGKAISVRERGPAWIVYPNVAYPEMQNDSIFETRSIWQLKELTIK